MKELGEKANEVIPLLNITPTVILVKQSCFLAKIKWIHLPDNVFLFSCSFKYGTLFGQILSDLK